MRQESKTAAVIVLVVLSLPGVFFGAMPGPATAAPVVIDNLDGNKTVSWDFSNPLDYITTNATVAGAAQLSQTSGQIVHDSSQDFDDNNLTWDSGNLTISGGSIATKQLRKEEIENGTFDASPPWRFVDSPDGNVTSQWNSTGSTGAFKHDRAAPPLNSFDQMDSGAGTTWVAVPRGPNPQHQATTAQDAVVYHEPTASMRMDITFKGQVTGSICAQRSGAFDWSGYNDLSMWLNTTYPGPQVMQAYLNLLSTTAEWNSSRVWVTPSWKQYDFDISSFSTRSSIIRIEIRFTNVVSVTESVWIDDLWLYRFDTISQTASIYQDVLKENFTDNIPGAVMLSFRYRADLPLNLFANLVVRVNSTILTVPAINVSNGAAWTPRTLDVSSVMSSTGAYNISFWLTVYLKTQFASFIVVQIDDVSLTVPNYHGGTYESIPLYIGREVHFDQVTWSMTMRPGTNIDLEIRGGWTGNPSDGSWTAWKLHPSSPAFLLDNASGRYLQYRVALETTNVSVPVYFDRIQFTYHSYLDVGRVETTDFVPSEQLLGWRGFDAVRVVSPGTSVVFFASDDSGGNWTSAIPGTPLSSLTGPRMRIAANMTASNTTLTPTLLFLNVTYEFLGAVNAMTVTPGTWSGAAGTQAQFTASGKDPYGRTVPVTPAWTDDDPVGSVTPAGLYTAGAVGAWHICASSGGKVDCANVTVSLGSLFRIIVSPAVANLPAGGLLNLTAAGEDVAGNPIALTTTEWITDVGSFDRVSPESALFRAQGTAKTGKVNARESGVIGDADVTVLPSSSITIQGEVPDIIMAEDSPPMNLDLTPYLPSGPNPNDLTWYIEDAPDKPYTAFGEGRFGQHVLTITPMKDAWRNDSTILVLQNRSNVKATQQLWINITPVNDAPVFYDVPDLTLRYNSSYIFDYSPYIEDIDTPRAKLVLTTNDQFRAHVQGLTVNFTYDFSFRGQTVLVRLRISDGDKATETIQSIIVGDHAPPNVVKDLPDVTMQEDQILNDAFTEPLSQFFFDPDGEELAYGYAGAHLTAEFWSTIPGEVHVRLTPDPDWYGTELLTIRAKDPPGAEIAQALVVNVISVDDAPVLAWRDNVSVRYDDPYELDLTDYVSDVDTPASALTLSTDHPELVSVQRFMLTLLLPRFLMGSNTSVPLSVTLAGGSLSDYSNITVFVSDNFPPELKPGTSMPDVSFNEDEQANGVFSLSDYFTDPDSGPQILSYTVIASKVIGTVDPVDRTVSFRAPLNWNGQEVVHFRASDGAAYAMGRLTVKVRPVDDAPSVLQIPNKDLGSGGALAIDLRDFVYDVDNNITELTFTTSSLHVTTVGYMLVLDYRGGSQSETVTLTVSDGFLQNSTSFRVTVTPVPPTNGGNNKPGLLDSIWPWLVLIVAVVVVAAVLLMYNRTLNSKFAVEDVFMLGKDGRLIMHTTRHKRADRDEDSLAGMLSAIMAFIRESFDEAEDEDFRSFTFGERQVHVQRDTHFYFVAIYAGEPPVAAQESIANITLDVEKTRGEMLSEWKGDASEVRELRAFLDAFVARRKYRRGDWKRAASKGK